MKRSHWLVTGVIIIPIGVFGCSPTGDTTGASLQGISSAASTPIANFATRPGVAIGRLPLQASEPQVVPDCTGTLLSPHVVMTAAHCMAAEGKIESAQQPWSTAVEPVPVATVRVCPFANLGAANGSGDRPCAKWIGVTRIVSPLTRPIRSFRWRTTSRCCSCPRRSS